MDLKREQEAKLIEYNKKLISPQMHYIDYGLGVLKADALNNQPSETPFDISIVYNKLSLQKQLAGYEVFERFYEIGSLQGIVDTQKYLSQKITKDSL